MGEGMLLMAISRVRKLSGLKLIGCYSLKQMKLKATVDWKVVHSMAKYFDLPPAGVRWAAELHARWLDAWSQHDRRMGERRAGKRPAAASGASSSDAAPRRRLV